MGISKKIHGAVLPLKLRRSGIRARDWSIRSASGLIRREVVDDRGGHSYLADKLSYGFSVFLSGTSDLKISIITMEILFTSSSSNRFSLRFY